MKNKHLKRTLHYHLGRVFQEDLVHVLGQEFFTITHISWEAHELIIYISLYHSTDHARLFAQIQQHTAQIRHCLSQRLSKHVRRMPVLRFVQDTHPNEQQRIEELLSSIRS